MWHSRMVEYDGKDAYLCITSETNKTILHFIKFDTESRQFEEIYTFRP